MSVTWPWTTRGTTPLEWDYQKPDKCGSCTSCDFSKCRAPEVSFPKKPRESKNALAVDDFKAINDALNAIHFIAEGIWSETNARAEDGMAYPSTGSTMTGIIEGDKIKITSTTAHPGKILWGSRRWYNMYGRCQFANPGYLSFTVSDTITGTSLMVGSRHVAELPVTVAYSLVVDGQTIESYNLVQVAGTPTAKREFSFNYSTGEVTFHEDIVPEEGTASVSVTFFMLKMEGCARFYDESYGDETYRDKFRSVASGGLWTWTNCGPAQQGLYHDPEKPAEWCSWEDMGLESAPQYGVVHDYYGRLQIGDVVTLKRLDDAEIGICDNNRTIQYVVNEITQENGSWYISLRGSFGWVSGSTFEIYPVRYYFLDPMLPDIIERKPFRCRKSTLVFPITAEYLYGDSVKRIGVLTIAPVPLATTFQGRYAESARNIAYPIFPMTEYTNTGGSRPIYFEVFHNGKNVTNEVVNDENFKPCAFLRYSGGSFSCAYPVDGDDKCDNDNVPQACLGFAAYGSPTKYLGKAIGRVEPDKNQPLCSLAGGYPFVDIGGLSLQVGDTIKVTAYYQVTDEEAAEMDAGKDDEEKVTTYDVEQDCCHWLRTDHNGAWPRGCALSKLSDGVSYLKTGEVATRCIPGRGTGCSHFKLRGCTTGHDDWLRKVLCTPIRWYYYEWVNGVQRTMVSANGGYSVLGMAGLYPLNMTIMGGGESGNGQIVIGEQPIRFYATHGLFTWRANCSGDGIYSNVTSWPLPIGPSVSGIQSRFGAHKIKRNNSGAAEYDNAASEFDVSSIWGGLISRALTLNTPFFSKTSDGTLLANNSSVGGGVMQSAVDGGFALSWTNAMNNVPYGVGGTMPLRPIEHVAYYHNWNPVKALHLSYPGLRCVYDCTGYLGSEKTWTTGKCLKEHAVSGENVGNCKNKSCPDYRSTSLGTDSLIHRASASEYPELVGTAKVYRVDGDTVVFEGMLHNSAEGSSTVSCQYVGGGNVAPKQQQMNICSVYWGDGSTAEPVGMWGKELYPGMMICRDGEIESGAFYVSSVTAHGSDEYADQSEVTKGQPPIFATDANAANLKKMDIAVVPGHNFAAGDTVNWYVPMIAAGGIQVRQITTEESGSKQSMVLSEGSDYIVNHVTGDIIFTETYLADCPAVACYCVTANVFDMEPFGMLDHVEMIAKLIDALLIYGYMEIKYGGSYTTLPDWKVL